MSTPDIEWWRRRALGWKRLAKRQRARAEWSDRPVLVGHLPRSASQAEVDEMAWALRSLSDRVAVLPEGHDIEFAEPQSVVLKKLIVALAEWRAAYENRATVCSRFSRESKLATVYDESPERVKRMGEE